MSPAIGMPSTRCVPLFALGRPMLGKQQADFGVS